MSQLDLFAEQRSALPTGIALGAIERGDGPWSMERLMGANA